MSVIAIVNRKGGSGKSTLATQLAGALARSGASVMLGDVDRQQSTVPWLKRRASQAGAASPILGWTVDPQNILRPPPGVAHVVLDTPGGLNGLALSRLLVSAHVVLMPVADSAFDRESAAACLGEIRAHPRVAAGKVQVAAVGMRIDGRTRAEASLRAWSEQHDVPLVAVLRSAQTYVRCIEHGLTVFDLPAARGADDVAQWQPLLDWLAPLLEASPPPVIREPRLSGAPGRPAGPLGARSGLPGTAAPAAARTSGALAPLFVPKAELTGTAWAPGRKPSPAAAVPQRPSPVLATRPAVGWPQRLLGWLRPLPQQGLQTRR